MSQYLFEAFNEMEELEDSTFSFDETGVEKLKSFMDGDTSDDFEMIVDPEAETEEDLKDSYVGKIILSCNVCHTFIYKNKEDVIIDDETGDANEEEECPYCMTAGGFKIVGQVADFLNSSEDEDNEESEDKEADTEEPEEVEESFKKKNFSLKEGMKETKEFISSFKDMSESELKRWYKEYKGSTHAIDKRVEKALKAELSKRGLLKEDFNKVDIETDREKMSMSADENGKVTVTTEPINKSEPTGETIAPISDEIKADIEMNSEEEDSMENETDSMEFEGEEDVSFDEFDEEEFDELGESYLKRVYENVNSYKTTKGSVDGNKLKLEGVITFKSGKKAKTNFVFESGYKTKTGKLKFIGENLQICEKKKAFTLTGRLKENKLCVESFNYNYNGRDSKTGKVSKLYGTIKKK